MAHFGRKPSAGIPVSLPGHMIQVTGETANDMRFLVLIVDIGGFTIVSGYVPEFDNSVLMRIGLGPRRDCHCQNRQIDKYRVNNATVDNETVDNATVDQDRANKDGANKSGANEDGSKKDGANKDTVDKVTGLVYGSAYCGIDKACDQLSDYIVAELKSTNKLFSLSDVHNCVRSFKKDIVAQSDKMYYTFESVDFEKKWGDIRRNLIQNAVEIHKAVLEGQPKITELCFTGGGVHDDEMVKALVSNTNGALDPSATPSIIPPPDYQ
jgi:hypothetical protein